MLWVGSMPFPFNGDLELPIYFSVTLIPARHCYNCQARSRKSFARSQLLSPSSCTMQSRASACKASDVSNCPSSILA